MAHHHHHHHYHHQGTALFYSILFIPCIPHLLHLYKVQIWQSYSLAARVEGTGGVLKCVGHALVFWVFYSYSLFKNSLCCILMISVVFCICFILVKFYLKKSCPNQGPTPQPRHISWPGIKPGTPQFGERHPTKGATLVREGTTFQNR